jgi:DNA-binding response OmpR family regulator
MPKNGRQTGAAISLSWCQEEDKKLHVLVIQPGPRLHRTLLRNLSGARYRVRVAETEAQVRALIEHESPDLVIIASNHEGTTSDLRRGRAGLAVALQPLILVIGQPESPSDGTVQVGDLALDLDARQAQHNQKVLRFSPKEFDLLTELMLHAGQVLSRDVLIHRVWGETTAASSRTLDVHIHWLREKIEADPSRPERIQTIPGVGYRFAASFES